MPKGESLTNSAYERIRSDILTCRAEPGQRMNIVAWAARLSVSTGAVREALSRLTAEGLVDAEPQRGFHVAEVSAVDLRQLTDARIALETLVLRRSIECGDVAWESRVVAARHALGRTPEREAGDALRLGDAWSAVHSSFHEALVCACDNTYLLELRRQLYTKSERYRRLSIPLARAPRDIAAEHAALADAALGRDGETAALLLSQHLRATASVLLKSLFPAVRAPNATNKVRARSRLSQA